MRAGWDLAASSYGYPPALGRFTVDIFDVSGRTVRRLEGDAGAASSTSIEWNGLDTNGRRVASGRYWVRALLRDGSMQHAVPVILLR